MKDAEETVVRARIAVVDDDRDVRDVMTEVLTIAGYEVIVQADAHAGLDGLAATRPDLVVLDLILGSDPDDLGGWEYLRLIRSHRALAEVPVLVISADLTALRQRAADAYVDPLVSVLEKPFSVDRLERAVVARLRGGANGEGQDLHAIVLVADGDARLVSASPAALRLLRIGPDELPMRHVSDIVVQPVEWTRREWERYLAARCWEGAVTLRLGDGSEVPAYSRATIVSENGVDFHVAHLELPTPPPSA